MGFRARPASAPHIPGQMRFDDEDELDIEHIIDEFAQNPYSEVGRTRETDAAALKAMKKMKEQLAPGGSKKDPCG